MFLTKNVLEFDALGGLFFYIFGVGYGFSAVICLLVIRFTFFYFKTFQAKEYNLILQKKMLHVKQKFFLAL